MVNPLLVEKSRGSAHIAMGASYEFTEYLGKPVRVDNGNRSTIHWDVTNMLFGKNGKIILDGEDIMQEGLFVDPKLKCLNGPAYM